VAPELEDQARERISITAHEYAFTPAEVATSAGIVTFDVVNDGKQPHELAFLPGGGDVPFTDGEPDEAALEKAGAFELEAFGPGQTCAATYDLAPGTYTLFCIVKSPDGTTHYQQGMRGTLTVS
jgi:plastocyanin